MPFTVTTWNIQNFSKSDPFFPDKLGYLVGTLQLLQPDVVALQEVLDTDALEALAQGMGFHASAGSPDGRGNRVAFLTRQPPLQPPTVIRDFRLSHGADVRGLDAQGNVVLLGAFRRPALQVRVQADGQAVDLLNAHFKSKLLTFGSRFSTNDESLRAHTAYFALELRAAEAATLREHVSDLLTAGRPTILVGDLNDGPEAATTQILYGPPGSQPRGPEDATQISGSFQRADAADRQRLFNVVKFVPEAQRWSRRHNGQGELLDHILASEQLLPRVQGLRQVPRVAIHNEDTPNLVGSNPAVAGVIPDHAPVTAVF